MFFVQTQYWYLLVVGFLVFCVLYLCLVEIWYFFLKWSKARLCHAHSEANRYRKERKQETCTDNSNGSEVSYHGSREEVDCRDCKYTRRQLSMEMSVRYVCIEQHRYIFSMPTYNPSFIYALCTCLVLDLVICSNPVVSYIYAIILMVYQNQSRVARPFLPEGFSTDILY